jgi:hypothetical protein
MPVVGRALFVRPSFEAATYVGSLALKRAVDDWAARGYAYTDLEGANATRANILGDLSSNDPLFTVLLGHGNETTYTAQNYERVFWKSDCGALAGRVVFALSCLTAAELGPDAVAKGCKTYMGYDEVFGWVMERIQDPLADRYARGFFEPVLELLYRLAGGSSAGDAYRASIDKWNYWIDYWSRSTDPAAPEVLSWLINDRDHQKLLGDETATVTVAVPIPTYIVMTVLGSLPVLVTAGIALYSELSKPKVVV